MEFKSTLWAVVIFSMIVVAAGVFLNETGDRYGSTITSDLSKDFNKLDEVSDNAQTIQGNINPQSGEASSNYESETFRGGYGIITGMFSYLRLIFGKDGMIQSAGERWGIPNYILMGLVSMISIAITLGIVAIVFRLSRSSA